MIGLVPASAVPPELVTALAEQGGPTVAVVAALWWRIRKLEEHLKTRIQRIDDDVSANSSLIYDRLLGQEYPKAEGADRPERAGRPRPPQDVDVESPRSSGD